MLEELSEQQILAARTVLEYADIEPNDDNLRRYISWEIVTFTEDAKGTTAGIWTMKATKFASMWKHSKKLIPTTSNKGIISSYQICHLITTNKSASLLQ